MKLLYINPSTNFYNSQVMPLSLLYLSAVTRKICETKILDLKTKKKGEEDLTLVNTMTLEYKPDIVGITCLFSGDIMNVLNYASCIKKLSPHTIIMVGGMHPTLYAKEIISNCNDIDIVFIGEGEDSTRKVLNAIIQGNSFSDIDGIAYRESNSMPLLTLYSTDTCEVVSPPRYEIKVVPKTNYIADIDSLPMPAYDLFDFDAYAMDTSNWYNPNHVDIKNGYAIPLLTSRSCPNQCSFCSMNQVMGLKFRARSVESVINEMEYLYNEYNVRYFKIMDDNLTLDKKRAIKICDAIVAKNMKIAFECSDGLSINALDKEVIEALVAAGLIRATVAIESGSDYLRNEIIGKHLKREKIYDVVSLFNNHPKVFLKACFIIGFPEETEATLNDTVNMIKELDLDSADVSTLIPLPGTRVFEQCKRDNLFLFDYASQNFWKEGQMYQSPEQQRFFIKPYDLPVEKLLEYRKLCDELTVEKQMNARKKGKLLATWHAD